MRGFLLAASLFAACLFASEGVSAHVHHALYHRHRHHHALHLRHRRLAGTRYVTPHEAMQSPMVRTALRYIGDGNITHFRGPWCGAFLGLVAHQTGVHTPPNPKLAANWAHAGPHLSRPEPGSIFVLPHHVALVLRSVGNWVLTVSGNHGNRVGLGWYPASRAIAFIKPIRN